FVELRGLAELTANQRFDPEHLRFAERVLEPPGEIETLRELPMSGLGIAEHEMDQDRAVVTDNCRVFAILDRQRPMPVEVVDPQAGLDMPDGGGWCAREQMHLGAYVVGEHRQDRVGPSVGELIELIGNLECGCEGRAGQIQVPEPCQYRRE